MPRPHPKKWFFKLGLPLLSLFLVVPKLVSAVSDRPDTEQLNKLFITLITYIRIIGYGAAVAAIIYAGILYFTAYGNEERPRQAKNIIIGAIIGIIIILLAQTIVLTILGQVSSEENSTPPTSPDQISALSVKDKTS